MTKGDLYRHRFDLLRVEIVKATRSKVTMRVLGTDRVAEMPRDIFVLTFLPE